MSVQNWPSVLLAAVVIAGTAGATTVYTDFGPGQTYNLVSGFVIAGSAGATPQSIATLFTPSLTGTLDSIDLGVSVGGGTPTFTVELTSDSSGLPGGIIESFSLGSLTNVSTIRTVSSVLHPSLSSLSNYWIVVLPGAASTGGAWLFSNSSKATTVFSEDGGTTWASTTFNAPAFDVNATTAAPEPATWLLLAAPLAGLVGLRRRRP